MEKGTGLAEDVRYYGEQLRNISYQEIGDLYPEIELPQKLGGGTVPVIAWIWTRTTKCSNPACGCEMPLASSYVLSKKKGNEAWVEPIVEEKKVRFIVHSTKCPKDKETPKQGRSAIFKCPACGAVTTDEYVKAQGKAHKIGRQLMAIVGNGSHGRIYLSPNEEHEKVADVEKPDDYPNVLCLQILDGLARLRLV